MRKAVKGEHCLNCGHPTGEAVYCAQCGQLNDTRRLSFWELVSESLSNFLALDGKVFKTLWLLLSKPGQVAADFKAGKRVRYMNPIRFYFLSSLLLISSIQLNRNEAEIIRFSGSDAADLPIKKKESNSIERSLELARLKEAYQAESNKGPFNRLDYLTDYLEESPQSSKAEVFGAFGMEANFWNDFLFDQAVKVEESRAAGNFNRFNRAFLSKLFWILFLFIPFFGLLLQVIYWRRDYYYPEHLFFTLYQQSIFFILAGLYNFLVENQTVFIVMMMLFASHLLLAMKRFYRQSWRKTLLKFTLINFMGIFAFAVFFVLAALVVFILL